MQGTELIDIWLNIAERRVPRDRYRPVASLDELPARVRGDSSLWGERFFTPAADPSRQTRARRSVHVADAHTPDLLRHEYAFKGWQLEVIESINFFIVRATGTPPILERTPAERGDAIRALAAAVLQMETADHRWVFDIPPAPGEGARFSTDPSADTLHLVSWTSRVDGGISQGRVFFLCYKKFFERADYRDIDLWFDDAFRARYGAR